MPALSGLRFASARRFARWNVGRVVGPAAALWLLAAPGCISLSWNREGGVKGPSIPFLPALSLLAGLGVSGLRDVVSRRGYPRIANVGAMLLVLTAFGRAAFNQQKFFFTWSPTEACRRVFQGNPFPESIAVAKYIREHTDPDARVAVIGSEPQIYFYSQRHSATGHIYTYGLMEEQDYALKMQHEMIHDIESAKPEYVVYVNVPTSWLLTPGSPRLIFDWFRLYARDNLEVVGIVDIVSPEKTEFRWGHDVISYKPQSDHVITIFRQKTGA